MWSRARIGWRSSLLEGSGEAGKGKERRSGADGGSICAAQACRGVAPYGDPISRAPLKRFAAVLPRCGERR